MKYAWLARFTGAALGLAATTAHADLYGALEAAEAQDYPRAFELYREIAELGRLEGQENLASMYVNGEGVKRDNVLGLAWAKIAAENGSTNVRNIIDQLTPHVTPNASARIDAVLAKFGAAALQSTLLPEKGSPADSNPCKLTHPANPDAFYPQTGVDKSIGANLVVDFEVQPDGRAHTARIVQSTTPVLFDEAARAVVMHSGFSPPRIAGVAAPCAMRIKIKFLPRPGNPVPDAIEDKLPATKERAEAGDPQSQFVYALVRLKYSELNTPGEPVLPWAVKAAQAGITDAQFFVGTHALYGMEARKDEAKGVAWLRLAAKAGHPLAQVELANYLVTRRGDSAAEREAVDLLERTVKTGYYAAKYSLATLLATSPTESIRDPKRALELMEAVISIGRYDPVPHQVVAAAKAALGEFEAAVRSQKLALLRARKLDWDVAPLEARLRNYEEKKAWTGNLLEK